MRSLLPKTTLLVAVILGSFGSAGAQDATTAGRWYTSVGGGIGWALEMDWTRIDALGATTVTRAATSFDTGWNIGGAVGYAVTDDVRFELEATYRSNGLDELTTTPAATASGDVKTTSIMVNALYDFDTGTPITPYIGPGLGLANVKTSWTTGGAQYEDDGWGFAFQATLGVSWTFTSNIEAFGQYQAFMVPHTQIRSSAPVAGGTTTFDLDGTYISHSLFLGLRYAF